MKFLDALVILINLLRQIDIYIALQYNNEKINSLKCKSWLELIAELEKILRQIGTRALKTIAMKFHNNFMIRPCIEKVLNVRKRNSMSKSDKEMIHELEIFLRLHPIRGKFYFFFFFFQRA